MGTRLNCLVEAVLTSTHNLCFVQNYEKYQKFLSENFHFFGGKIFNIVDRRVFVMYSAVSKTVIHRKFQHFYRKSKNYHKINQPINYL